MNDLVVIVYSFDPELPVYRFDTEEKAKAYLEKDYKEECRIQTEENEVRLAHHEMAPDRSYAVIEFENGDKIEWTVTSVKTPPVTEKPAEKAPPVQGSVPEPRPGEVIRCVRMKDDPLPVEPGTIGIVTGTDAYGHIYVQWENGRTLSLIRGIDEFETVETKEVHVTAYPYAVTTGTMRVPKDLSGQELREFVIKRFDAVRLSSPELDYAGTEIEISDM